MNRLNRHRLEAIAAAYGGTPSQLSIIADIDTHLGPCALTVRSTYELTRYISSLPGDENIDKRRLRALMLIARGLEMLSDLEASRGHIPHKDPS